MRIEYHRTLVADRVRNAAFHAALKAVITPGETVVADVGAGTGLRAHGCQARGKGRVSTRARRWRASRPRS